MSVILKSSFRQGMFLDKGTFPREQQSNATAGCSGRCWDALGRGISTAVAAAATAAEYNHVDSYR